MACRNLLKAEESVKDIKKSAEGLPNVGELLIKELDLSSFDSIRKCAQAILDSESAIHLLVNNAGMIFLLLYFSHYITEFNI